MIVLKKFIKFILAILKVTSLNFNCFVFLVSAFGELKIVRLPKKIVGTGPHRGFGFVDFVSRHDAKVSYYLLKIAVLEESFVICYVKYASLLLKYIFLLIQYNLKEK